MAMQNALRHIVVFIASPGDVPDARDRVRKAIERINRLLAKPLGILLEPMGWEDIPAGMGSRTQDLINPYVDTADIFVGVLNRRFGSPTGIAESGTEEEYNRVEKRWQRGEPRPAVMIFFKNLPHDAVVDPGEQLQRVLAFRKRISDTVLYKEFDTADDLSGKVEDELAQWVHQQLQAGSPTLTSSEQHVESLQPADLDILLELVQNPEVPPETIQGFVKIPGDELRLSLARLKGRGLIAEHNAKLRPRNSTEGFLATVKHLMGSTRWSSLLRSDYYNRMLTANLRHLVAARFHYQLEQETADLLRKCALLSPASASYLLFGDTSLYDNLAEHAGTLGQDHAFMANEMMKQSILFNVLLLYATDCTNARTIDTLDGQTVAGQAITLCVAAGFETRSAFRVSVTAPFIRGRAATDMQKGQLVSAPPAELVRIGTIFMNMGELDLALRSFDRASSPDNPPEVRSAALNNKGLILLSGHQLEQAIEVFREAVDLSPNRTEPLKNLRLAEAMRASEMTGS